MNQKNIIIFFCVIIVIIIFCYIANIRDSFSSDTSMYNIKDLSSKGVEGPAGPQGPSGPPGSNANFPRGVIVSWYGSANRIPKGWAVCNGTRGTPDLRDRFILGAGPKYRINRTGGQTQVRLETINIPRHTHSYQDIYWSEHHGWRAPGGSSRVAVPGRLGSRRGQDTDNAGYQFRRQTGSYGGGSGRFGSPTNNMPPYRALLFIMKL